jgi:hypothetical protein
MPSIFIVILSVVFFIVLSHFVNVVFAECCVFIVMLSVVFFIVMLCFFIVMLSVVF